MNKELHIQELKSLLRSVKNKPQIFDKSAVAFLEGMIESMIERAK